jgi:carbamoyl-phosphate synthase small subunit
MNAGYLLLEDGRRFDGLLFGRRPDGLPADNAAPGIGEVVFQTGMTGYQEVVTDPSYRGQIVTFTAPHIGNTGMNAFDDEAPTPALAGVVLRSLCERPSSWRSEESLPEYQERHGIPGLTEVDTRALTRHLRDAGALRGAIAAATVDGEVALARVRAFPGLAGRDLVREVAPASVATDFQAGAAFPGSTPRTLLHGTSPLAVALGFADEFPYQGLDADGRLSGDGRKIVLVHCGMKEGIDLALRRRGAEVRVVGPNASPEEILSGHPDGLLLSNGPGDPDALETLIRTTRALLGRLPIFGICLGHQVLALALGARTYKMKFGHHGINHPVRDLETGSVLVTSQNHGFAVDPDTLKTLTGGDRQTSAVPTHVSLNDQTLEGFAVPELKVRAVQFHPESNAGPHDARRLFEAAGRPGS